MSDVPYGPIAGRLSLSNSTLGKRSYGGRKRRLSLKKTQTLMKGAKNLGAKWKKKGLVSVEAVKKLRRVKNRLAYTLDKLAS